MEKEIRIDIPKVLGNMAEKYGYKLAKITQNKDPELPKGFNKYRSYTAQQIVLELKDIELRIKTLTDLGNRARIAISSYMKKQKPEIHTKELFVGGIFDDRKILIQNKELILLQNLKEYLENLMKETLQHEMTNNFLAGKEIENDIALQKSVKSLKIQSTDTQYLLIAEIESLIDAK